MTDMEKDFVNLNKEIDKIIKKAETNVIKNYSKTLETLRNDIRKLYDKYEKDGILSMDQMVKYDRLKKFDNNILLKVSNLYKENSTFMDNTLRNIFKYTRDETIDIVQKKTEKSLIPIKKTLDIEKTVNEKMAGLHWTERMGYQRNDCIYKVQKTLKEGLAQGSSYGEMSKRLNEELNGKVIQPVRIIRTEGARVYQSTQIESLDKIAQKGLQMTKKWVTANDERVRSQHREMDGIIVRYEEDFLLPDGTHTKAPHLTGVAEHDIHCRCIMTIDLQDFYQEERLEAPEIKNEKVKENYDDFKNYLDKKSENNVHAVKMKDYLEYTEFVEDKIMKGSYSYSEVDDVIKFNPKSKLFDKYDTNYALAHELSHRMDVLEYQSYKNESFIKSIEESKKVFYDNKEKIKRWFDDGEIYAEDEAVSDIISAITKGEANTFLPVAHEKEYWENEDNIAAEAFANLSSIDLLDNGKYSKFKEVFKNLFNSYLEVIK